MTCAKCGKTYSYAARDVKMGKIPHPELCVECGGLKVGEVKVVTKTENYFKSGIQRKKKTEKDEPEGIDFDDNES